MSRLDLPADVEDGIRVAVCVLLFMGLGLGLYRPLTGDFLFSDIIEFCSWCVVALLPAPRVIVGVIPNKAPLPAAGVQSRLSSYQALLLERQPSPVSEY